MVRIEWYASNGLLLNRTLIAFVPLHLLEGTAFAYAKGRPGEFPLLYGPPHELSI